VRNQPDVQAGQAERGSGQLFLPAIRRR
jgi:hypothetical protein